MNKQGKTQAAVISGLAGLFLVLGGSVAAVASGAITAPTPTPTEVAYAAPVGDAASFDRAAAIQTAAADKAARDQAAADALAAQIAWEAQVAAQAAADAQAAAENAARASQEASASDEPAEDSGPSRTPATWVDLGNGTGLWDFSNCPTGSGSTGSDGNVYCN